MTSNVPSTTVERRFWNDGLVVAGIDEVGRGAWAGPVTVGAVILPRDRRMYKLRDSKKLTPRVRNQRCNQIIEFADAVALGHAGNTEIDVVGMSHALRRAARRAIAALPVQPDVVLIDGNWNMLKGTGLATELIVKGDSVSVSIAAASIIAKVSRDRWMQDVADHRFPQYGFAGHKGYSCARHREALAAYGPCPYHRVSWKPIRDLPSTSS